MSVSVPGSSLSHIRMSPWLDGIYMRGKGEVHREGSKDHDIDELPQPRC
jgi:hypothetical protein